MRRLFSLLSGEPCRILLGAAALVFALLTDGIPQLAAAILGMLVTGVPVLLDALRGILRRDLLDEKFLMTVASLGALCLGEYTEAVAVLLFFLVGEYFEHRAVRGSRRSIRALMDICPDRATVMRGGEPMELDADEVRLGETVRLSPGERIPVDCTVLSGEALVDTAAVTGEPVPIEARAGVALHSGCVCLDGVLYARADAAAEESAASRILALVETAQERKSRQEAFITHFSRVYTPAVVGVALFLGGLLPLLLWACFAGGPVAGLGVLYRRWIHRALIFLVVSCPCALVISVPLSFFGGIGGAASIGILFKGGNRLHAIAAAKTVCFDKTGTLTRGEFAVTAVHPSGGISADGLLLLAASAECGSTHPIARAIRREAKGEPRIPSGSRELAGRGVISLIGGASVAVGNAALMREQLKQPTGALSESEIHVARDGVYLGSIAVGDSLRPDAAPAVKALYRLGIRRTVMLTGDSRENAEAVSASLGLDGLCAALTPEGKYRELERLEREGNAPILFVGDGINDAPVLARADVGIAFGGIGSDAAIEAADAVLMSDSPMRVAHAIVLARKTVRIATENIVFALGVKLSILALSAFGIVDSMWLAVFADVGVALLAILNAMRTIDAGRRLLRRESKSR